MAPKVEISEETISRLVKDHLSKESDEGGVKKHVRKHGLGYAKLTASIGALTVALNAYSILEKENVELAKKNLEISQQTQVIAQQNRVIFQAVSTKVNGMAERLAYVEGRLEGKKPKAAEKAIKERVKPIRRNGGGTGSTGVIHTKAKGKTMTKARPVNDTVAVVASMDMQQQMMQPSINVEAYDVLPEDLDELIEIEEEMAQEQYQDEP